MVEETFKIVKQYFGNEKEANFPKKYWVLNNKIAKN